MARRVVADRPAAERYGYVAGAAFNDLEPRKTEMAAPVNFSRWLAGIPAGSAYPRLFRRLRVDGPQGGTGAVPDVGIALLE